MRTGADSADWLGASMTRRYIVWRSNRAYDEGLHRVVDRATLPDAAPA
jgi:hypothetical protein